MTSKGLSLVIEVGSVLRIFNLRLIAKYKGHE